MPVACFYQTRFMLEIFQRVPSGSRSKKMGSFIDLLLRSESSSAATFGSDSERGAHMESSGLRIRLRLMYIIWLKFDFDISNLQTSQYYPLLNTNSGKT